MENKALEIAKRNTVRESYHLKDDARLPEINCKKRDIDESTVYNLREIEKLTIERAMSNFPNDTNQFIADILGISYKTLLRKIKVYNIVPNRIVTPEINIKEAIQELTKQGYRFNNIL